MKQLLVLGAGTAGTIVVNKLRPRLSADEWAITVVDPDPEHHYQPGYLFVPFGLPRRDHPAHETSPMVWSWSWQRSIASSPTSTACCWPTGPSWPTTSW